MNKHDWVFVGIRVLGIWLFTQGVLSIVPALRLLTEGTVGFIAIVMAAVLCSVGWILARHTADVGLFLGAPAEKEAADE